MKMTLIPGAHREGKTLASPTTYMPTIMCASPASVSSMGQVQVILTWLEPSVLLGTVVKKSRILWNEEKEKPLIELYEQSNRTRHGAMHRDSLRCGR